MLLNAAGAGRLVWLLAKLPTAAAALLSLAPLILPERGRRIRAAVVAVSLCVLSYNLTYFQGFEYHYAALLPLLPAMLWLWQRESAPWLRPALMGCFLASLPLFLPIPTSSARTDPYVWAVSSLQRVGPVMIAFYGLLIYGVTSAWLARAAASGRAANAPRPPRHALLGGLIGLLLCAVAASVYATVPARLRIATKNWTPRDWETHLEDVISRPGVAPEVLAGIHRDLGQLYAAAEPRTALEHYRKAAAFPSPFGAVPRRLGRRLSCHRPARRSDRTVPKGVGTRSAPVKRHNNLGAALVGRGRIDEAMAQFQRALEIKPDNAEAHNNLGFALAGRGQIDEAMAHFRKP